MSYYHPEEEFQVWAVESYEEDHPGTRYLVEFADGEGYVATFKTAFDSENGGDLEIPMDDPLYDEFHQVSFEIVDEVHGGERRYHQFLTVDYRDFPSRVTDVDTNTVVYPES